MGRAERQASIICRMAHARRAAQVALLAAILFVTMPSTYGFSPDSTSEDVIHLAEDLGEATRKTVAVPVKPLKAKKPAKVKATAKAKKARGGKAKPKTSSGGTKKVSQTHVAKAAKKVSEKATAVLHKNKQRDLRLVERLLKNPIIDPRTEKAYKRAAESVEKSKKKIKAKLANVEEMAIVADKVNEAQAKKAAALANAASGDEQLAGTAMERAAKARAGCVDSHPGICAGVKVQGHCGIKAYAKACSLSCHLCSITPSFVMGSHREKRHKGAVEKAGKHAAGKEARREAKKVREKQSKQSKAKEKLEKARQSRANAKNSLESKEKSLARSKGAGERKLKQAKGQQLMAKEKEQKAKEKLKKDKAKLHAKRVSAAKVRLAKEKAKKQQERVKRNIKRAKAALKAYKKAKTKLSKARKRRSKYNAAMEKLGKARKKAE